MQTNNVTTDKYGIRFTGGTTLPQRLATLTHDGPLLVNKDSWLALAGKALLPTPDANDDVEISYYILGDVLSGAWIKTLDLRRQNMSYTVTLGAASDMLAALDAAGLSWDQATSFEEMRRRVASTSLLVAEAARSLNVPQVHAVTANTHTWYEQPSTQ